MSWVERIMEIERGLGATDADLSSEEFLEMLGTIEDTVKRWEAMGMGPAEIDVRVVEVYCELTGQCLEQPVELPS